jgi:hypothetical protein
MREERVSPTQLIPGMRNKVHHTAELGILARHGQNCTRMRHFLYLACTEEERRKPNWSRQGTAEVWIWLKVDS